ncbi:hypothetical protein [Actinoplanes italicus]|uniref:hypothetical protein n=1 Tax=Actinoplanes italicus TaxID=113567 RepID=UPI000D081970|nr:hypothetical protein [Actinoplanes italicus]
MTLGVLIATYVSLDMPAHELPLQSALTAPEGQTIIQRYGPAATLLTLLPALLAAIPTMLPAHIRTWATTAAAAALTALTPVAGNLGLYYLPVTLMLWATTIVPWTLRRGIGRTATRAWHLTAAAFLALPALPAGAAILTDDTGIAWYAVGLWVITPLALATLCALAIPAGYAATALAGTLVMAASIVDQGFLFAAFWLFATAYLTIGASGLTATRARSKP